MRARTANPHPQPSHLLPLHHYPWEIKVLVTFPESSSALTSFTDDRLPWLFFTNGLLSLHLHRQSCALTSSTDISCLNIFRRRSSALASFTDGLLSLYLPQTILCPYIFHRNLPPLHLPQTIICPCIFHRRSFALTSSTDDLLPLHLLPEGSVLKLSQCGC